MAIQKCEEAIRHDPFFAPAFWSRSFLKMLQGDYSYYPEYGWYDDPRYEPKKGWFRRHVNTPIWTGDSLKGKSIYLYCDEGYGDFFQFLRYVKLIKDLGAYTVVECLPQTEILTKSCPGVDEITSCGASTDGADLHCPLMLVPRYFDIEKYIPTEVPYLSPTRTDNENLYLYLNLAENHSAGIGCVWAGNANHSNDKNRSVGADLFKRLKVNDTLISLQHGAFDPYFLNLGMMFKDWNDTANAISKLRLVITVDTAVAHLAGAMGKECWVMLPKTPDWRWGLEGEHNRWYPSIRLFRKNTSWEDVMDRISARL
jgi:hypothetical protein